MDIYQYRSELESALNSPNYRHAIDQIVSQDASYCDLLQCLRKAVRPHFLSINHMEPIFRHNSEVIERKALASDFQKIVSWSVPCIISAKLNDYLWLTMRSVPCARKACEEFIHFVQASVDLHDIIQAIYRVVSIRKSLDRTNAGYTDLTSALRPKLVDWEGKPLLLQLFEVCSKYEILSSDEMLAHIENSVDLCCTDPANCDLIQRYVSFYISEYQKKNPQMNIKVLDREEQIVRLRRKQIGNLYLSINHFDSQNTLAIRRTDLIERTIQILKKIPGTDTEREDLRKKLTAAQQLLRSQMAQNVQELDLSEPIIQYKEQLSLLNKEECLYFLVYAMSPLNYRDEVERMKHRKEDYALLDLFPVSQINEKGQTVSNLRPLGNAQETDTVFQEYLIFHASHQIALRGFIVGHLRSHMLERHEICLSDIQKIVNNSAFVPTDRRESYAKGLLAGFQRDYMTALHILIPQFENSIRLFAESCGVLVDNLNEDGTMEAKTLHSLMAQPQIIECMDDDWRLTIQVLFCSPIGKNIRNLHAHGLLTDGFFHSREAIYIWWFIYYCCYKLQNIDSVLTAMDSVQRKLRSETQHTDQST